MGSKTRRHSGLKEEREEGEEGEQNRWTGQELLLLRGKEREMR